MSGPRNAMRMAAAGLLTLLLAAGGKADLARQTTGEEFVTSAGVHIWLEAVERMPCGQLRAKLQEIDETGYRGLRPAPVNERDLRLLTYETQVSMRYYSGCAYRRLQIDASDALRRGFNPHR
ncbi:MAG: hypothetical protein ACQEUZ_02350 [Pseudomonadota bacterium]